MVVFPASRSLLEIQITVALINIAGSATSKIFEVSDASGSALGVRRFRVAEAILAAAKAAPLSSAPGQGLRLEGSPVGWDASTARQVVSHLLGRIGSSAETASLEVTVKEGKQGDQMSPLVKCSPDVEALLMRNFSSGVLVTWKGGAFSITLSFSQFGPRQDDILLDATQEQLNAMDFLQPEGEDDLVEKGPGGPNAAPPPASS
jgi:hypothetical protein